METDPWTGAEALSAMETVTSRNQMTLLHQRELVVRPRYVDCRQFRLFHAMCLGLTS